jgi:ABC-type phosphonate transport system ATPase subunit
MQYKSFRIRNFKGIRDTSVQLAPVAGASVFAFVGLNESGKTTVLEAIHSFSPDTGTRDILGAGEGVGVPIKDCVPRHLISSFTGDVSITATIGLSADDKDLVAEQLWDEHEIQVQLMPDEINIERHHHFEGGDFKKSHMSIRGNFSIKSGQQRKWRLPTFSELESIKHVLWQKTPDIAYFPTFVFNFPEVIYLTDRGGKVDKFYRRVFQDILDYDGRGHTIEKDITRRVRSQQLKLPFFQFFSLWNDHDDKAKIEQIMDRASSAVTKLVFGQWNRIFGEDVRGKEVLITHDVVEGEVIDDSSGAVSKTHDHDVRIKFQIKDGTRRFDVNDRSLGFRWFFSFMLFTQFRVARSETRPLLFLFDEPASNLHASAQQRLIDCFPNVAKSSHMLAYSTHSHYMIEPKWLEQTFIITNRSDAPPSSSIIDDISMEDESLDVKVDTYRSFVNKHPSHSSYFQPILDRLQVVPSRFDLFQPSAVVEGKSDYYILRYAAKLLGRAEVALIPGLGAGSFEPLAAIHVGWNLNFIFVLDGDRQGKLEKERYAREYGIALTRLVTLTELTPALKVIEDLFDQPARAIIAADLSLASSPTKAQICRFCQERLASDKFVDLGEHFRAQSAIALDGIAAKLDADF